MKNYELVIVLDGKTTSAKKKTVTEKIEKLVTSAKGKIGKINDLGTKDLAYPIKKSTSGIYLVLPLELEPLKAKEVSTKIRLENDIIRYLLISK